MVYRVSTCRSRFMIKNQEDAQVSMKLPQRKARDDASNAVDFLLGRARESRRSSALHINECALVRPPTSRPKDDDDQQANE